MENEMNKGRGKTLAI